jgi:hypothetical protein
VTLIHVLSPGFVTPNGRAFLFPLVVWREALAATGLRIRLFDRVTPDLADCDALLIDSKFYRADWSGAGARILDEIAGLAAACRVVFCDTTDSASWLKAEVLPLVHAYAKGQLLRDRSHYGRRYYGHRTYADFYYRKLNIEDADPEWSPAVTDPTLLAKLRLSWNAGLADYSMHGPLRMAVYGHVPLRLLLRFPREFMPSEALRHNDLSCRFGTGYPRASVAAQRQLIRERLIGRINTRKLSRRAYMQELSDSRIVVSPFGFGEITLKDFEVFLTGGALLKPDMSHMETWPDLFWVDETMLVHAWDLSDFDEVLERAMADRIGTQRVAMNGQAVYREYMHGDAAVASFAAQLQMLIF